MTGPETHPPERDRDDTEMVGGFNAVLAALKSRPKAARQVMVAEGRHRNAALDEIYALARGGAGLSVKRVPRQALDRLYGREGHQGVVALFAALDYVDFDDFLETLVPGAPALILALDRVEDPQNLGALMRSALVFGAAGVIVPRERAASLTPAAVRASAGAAEALPLVRVVNLRRALEILQKCGFWIIGAEGEGESDLSGFAFPERAVITLGSEGRGLSPVIKKTCDHLVSIPQQRDRVTSLNVSVAGGILMYSYFQQIQTE